MKFRKRALSLFLALVMAASLFPAALAAETGSDPATVYSDVAPSKYYAGYLDQLTRAGVVSPVNGKFNPNTPCTRGEFVTWLWRAAGKPAAAAVTTMKDVAAGTELASAVAWAEETGVTTGANTEAS